MPLNLILKKEICFVSIGVVKIIITLLIMSLFGRSCRFAGHGSYMGFPSVLEMYVILQCIIIPFIFFPIGYKVFFIEKLSFCWEFPFKVMQAVDSSNKDIALYKGTDSSRL